MAAEIDIFLNINDGTPESMCTPLKKGGWVLPDRCVWQCTTHGLYGSLNQTLTRVKACDSILTHEALRGQIAPCEMVVITHVDTRRNPLGSCHSMQIGHKRLIKGDQQDLISAITR